MRMYAQGMECIPMWTGFSGQTYTDHLPEQSVLYMTNISHSPTNNDVMKTLSMTLTFAEECRQPYDVVTEQPRLDNICIMFGVFHVEMCLLTAIGEIKESGMPEILVEAKVLASESLKGFQECKNFIRCKRLHPMLALAF